MAGEDLILLAGGPGNQSGASVKGCVVKRSVWEVSIPSDFFIANGEALYEESFNDQTIDFDDVDTVEISGNFSNAIVGMYIYIYNVDQGTNAIGFYEILTATGTELTFSSTGVKAGVQIDTDETDVSYSIGGTRVKSGGEIADIEGANDDVFTELVGNSVEVLHNKSEAPGSALTLDADSTALYQLVFTGCIHDASVPDNNFVRATQESDMPVLTMGNNAFSSSGKRLLLRSLSITGARANSKVVDITGDLSEARECVFAQTSNGVNALEALSLTDSSAYGCKITSVSTHATEGAVVLFRGTLNSSTVESVARGMRLESASNRVSSAIGNTFKGSGANAAIYVANPNATSGPIIVAYNMIYNYAEGLKLDPMGDINELAQPEIHNNVMWLANVGSSIGVQNDDVATSVLAIINNNFIGNVVTRYQMGQLLIENDIVLTADPFNGAAGGDFTLNNVAGGGALVRGAKWPSDLDLDGTDEDFASGGALQLAAGGGAVHPIGAGVGLIG